MGLIDGRIGIGAPTKGVTPLVQVARFAAEGRLLAMGVVSGVFACPGLMWSAGAGDSVRDLLGCCGTAGALSRVMRDFLNHDGLEVRGGASLASLLGFDSIVERFLPSSRLVDDFGCNGSCASEKYSWLNA